MSFGVVLSIDVTFNLASGISLGLFVGEVIGLLIIKNDIKVTK